MDEKGVFNSKICLKLNVYKFIKEHFSYHPSELSDGDHIFDKSLVSDIVTL